MQAAALCAVLVLAGCWLVMLVKTKSWPLISDAILMRYADFLLHHGMVPYRQIVDVNLPGSYALDNIVTHVFGFSALAWRCFDTALIVGALACFLALIGRKGWHAGVFAGSLFALIHAADGVAQEAQRDLVMAVLLMAGCVALFKKNGLWSAFVFGLCCGSASTLKPQAIAFLFAIFLIGPLGLSGRVRVVSAAIAGAFLPIAIMGVWLWHQDALSAFLQIAKGLMRYHAGMARHTLAFLVAHAISGSILPLLVPALALLITKRTWRYPKQQIALFGIAFGVFSFCLQGKAYPYHRYPLLAFSLLLVALELQPVLVSWVSGNSYRLESACAWFLLGYGALWLGPSSTAKAIRYDWRSQPSLNQLQADLTQVRATLSSGSKPGAALDRSVQCMDTIAGCITVLNRMQLVQSTGFLYDCYFFAPGTSSVKEDMRTRFLTQIKLNPPKVFVVTDNWCLNLPGGYEKLQQWPAFTQLLDADYAIVQQRAWSAWNKRTFATWPFGYRIYVRQAAIAFTASQDISK